MCIQWYTGYTWYTSMYMYIIMSHYVVTQSSIMSIAIYKFNYMYNTHDTILNRSAINKILMKNCNI